MSTYHGRFRTNYFHVTDVEKFKNLMSRILAYSHSSRSGILPAAP